MNLYLGTRFSTNVQPYFYACYLLLSVAPLEKNIVYVGSTPNPIRRLRQHNGEIKGGAKKTATKRPWEMVVVVYGLEDNISKSGPKSAVKNQKFPAIILRKLTADFPQLSSRKNSSKESRLPRIRSRLGA